MMKTIPTSRPAPTTIIEGRNHFREGAYLPHYHHQQLLTNCHQWVEEPWEWEHPSDHHFCFQPSPHSTIQWFNSRNQDFIRGNDIEGKLPSALPLRPKDHGPFPPDLQLKPSLFVMFPLSSLRARTLTFLFLGPAFSTVLFAHST